MRLLKRYRVALVLVVLGAVVAGLVVARFRDQKASARVRPPRETVVGVVKPERRDLEATLIYSGDVLPTRQTAIFSKVSGYLRAIHVERGDFVKAGQLLVEVEPTELEAIMDQSRAALATAVAGLRVARSTLESARANLLNQQATLARAQALMANDERQAQRMAELFDRGLIAAQERDNARTAHESSRAAVQAQQAQVQVARVQIDTADSQVGLAEAQVEQQRAALRTAQVRLEDTRLTAPFDGYVATRQLETGAAVNAQAAATSNSSIAILTIQEIDPIKVQIEVPERDVARVRPGQGVRLTTDAYPERKFTGTLARVIHALDPRTRTMGVEVQIANADLVLKPGMYARVEVVLDVARGALLIPMEALEGSEARASVLVVREGKVTRVPVRLGATDGPSVQISAGLTADDQVIVQGRDLVREGAAVNAVPAKSY